MEEQLGLYSKYTVHKAATGEPVLEAFVLRPEKDEAARAALKTYANACLKNNVTLASDILWWVALIEAELNGSQERP